MTVECPECEGDVEVGANDKQGDVVECEDCGADLEITKLNPPELELVEEDDSGDEDED